MGPILFLYPLRSPFRPSIPVMVRSSSQISDVVRSRCAPLTQRVSGVHLQAHTSHCVVAHSHVFGAAGRSAPVALCPSCKGVVAAASVLLTNTKQYTATTRAYFQNLSLLRASCFQFSVESHFLSCRGLCCVMPQCCCAVVCMSCVEHLIFCVCSAFYVLCRSPCVLCFTSLVLCPVSCGWCDEKKT